MEEEQSEVRLRLPERHQLSWMAECLDDIVEADHEVRLVMGVVEKLDLSEFYKPIKAREGVAGRDATDPRLLVGLWLYACIRGFGSARELARQCEESAAFRWLCGGVTVNHRLLSEFRVDRAGALDKLFTQVLALLVAKKVLKVSRVSQDGVRVRVGAGSKSFRRQGRLQELLEKAQKHVELLREQVDSPDHEGLSKQQKAARKRAAEDRLQRAQAALEQLPELEQRQAETERRAGQGKYGQRVREREVRVSTTDAEARVMKMPNGGYNPAVNVQLATDTESRVIVGVEVSNQGSDSSGLSEPMRQQVEQRTGQEVKQHLVDGGYLRNEDLEQAHADGVELFVPPKPARNPSRRGQELDPKPGDSEAMLDWKQRMSSEQGKKIYKQRASTSETVNADLRTYRGLSPIMVRGLAKAKSVALWCALAYNVMHFGSRLVS
jgi:transposase